MLGRRRNLSGHGLERQLRKELVRLPFRGLTLADRVPEEQTLREFRERRGELHPVK